MKSGRLTKLGYVLIATAVLAGCTASPQGTATSPEPSAASSGPSAAAEAIVAEVKNDFEVQPGTAEDGYTGASDDVTVSDCTSGAEGTTVSGTVTNPTEAAASYRIYVSIMSGTDTLGIVQTDVAELAAGESADWTKDAEAGDEGATCVLRVERVTAP